MVPVKTKEMEEFLALNSLQKGIDYSYEVRYGKVNMVVKSHLASCVCFAADQFGIRLANIHTFDNTGTVEKIKTGH